MSPELKPVDQQEIEGELTKASQEGIIAGILSELKKVFAKYSADLMNNLMGRLEIRVTNIHMKAHLHEIK